MSARAGEETQTEADRALSVAEVLAALEEKPSPAEILDLLDRGAAALVSADLVHRLIPFAGAFRDLDFAAHPWAALPGGVALCAVDRAFGRAILTTARLELERRGDRQGLGFAYFLEGLEDLGEGNLTGADGWWAQARELLGDVGPVSEFAALHHCLVAYGEGDLARASFLAEHALGSARRRGDDRVEAAAAVYLALFRSWVGDFRGVEAAADVAERAHARMADPLDRYEAPLVDGVRAALAYARGDAAGGDECLERGLQKADELHNEWYRAILQTISAQFAAGLNPLRSMLDARAALDYYERVDEQWWSRWALEAYVIAQRAYGDLHASRRAARELLAVVDNPLERGRASLQLAITLIALHENDEAKELLEAGIGALERAGAHYWAARAEVELARAHPSRTEYLMRSVRRRAEHQADDPAWKLLTRGAPLRLQLLGAPRAFVGDAPVVFERPQELRALAMLALAGPRGLPAEALASALWPDSEPSRVRHRVDVLLSGLRHTLLPATPITRSRGVIALDIDPDACDVNAALSTATRLLADPTPPDPWVVAHCLQSLSAPLFGGGYEEWITEHQHRVDALRDRLEAESGATGRVPSARR